MAVAVSMASASAFLAFASSALPSAEARAEEAEAHIERLSRRLAEAGWIGEEEAQIAVVGCDHASADRSVVVAWTWTFQATGHIPGPRAACGSSRRH